MKLLQKVKGFFKKKEEMKPAYSTPKPRYLMNEDIEVMNNSKNTQDGDMIINEVGTVVISTNDIELTTSHTYMKVFGDEVEIEVLDYEGGFNLNAQFNIYNSKSGTITQSLDYKIKNAVLRDGKFCAKLDDVKAIINDATKG